MINSNSVIDPDLEVSSPPRSKWEYPYSYDPFVIWRSGTQAAQHTAYSDRLQREDAFNEAAKVVMGNQSLAFGTDMDPEIIEKVMQMYLKKPSLKIIRVVEYCNPSSGSPYWRLDYVTNG
ncbi:hypothetical protein [Bdellovibrio sp. BCCA]|uniref:hypothetical protein n=1 Tax=Bdellovibrio sp. BCCA TaxID=3136281 RepID=UPI0030EFEF76